MTASPMAEIISNTFGDVCTISPYAGPDSRGQPTYGTPRTAACRVFHTLDKVMKPNGEIATIRSSYLMLAAADTIIQFDMVAMNDVDGIVQITGTLDHVNDRDGNTLYKVVRF